jgi:hypothetical protein
MDEYPNFVRMGFAWEIRNPPGSAGPLLFSMTGAKP